MNGFFAGQTVICVKIFYKSLLNNRNRAVFIHIYVTMGIIFESNI